MGNPTCKEEGDDVHHILYISQWHLSNPICKEEPQIVAKSRPNLTPWAVGMLPLLCNQHSAYHIIYHTKNVFPYQYDLAEYVGIFINYPLGGCDFVAAIAYCGYYTCRMTSSILQMSILLCSAVVIVSSFYHISI